VALESLNYVLLLEQDALQTSRSMSVNRGWVSMAATLRSSGPSTLCSTFWADRNETFDQNNRSVTLLLAALHLKEGT
jgi:hypothetical protein